MEGSNISSNFYLLFCIILNFYFQSFQGLFKGHECPTPVATEFANNQTWYVTFATEDDALKAYSYLRDEVKTFKVKKQTSFELLLLKRQDFEKLRSPEL